MPKKVITAAGIARAKVDPELVAALNKSIQDLAVRALPKVWADLLEDYAVLSVAMATTGGGGLYPADFAAYVKNYTEALYDVGEAEAASSKQKGKKP